MASGLATHAAKLGVPLLVLLLEKSLTRGFHFPQASIKVTQRKQSAAANKKPRHIRQESKYIARFLAPSK
jgi:hypothetical protein